ncbi:MAG: hypothetical protein P8M13_03330, partial [Luminiphilus sp.]|nr:hypothetical protein [Luminiphilus sp.]
DAETVQIGLDGVQLLDVAYGSDRLDTQDVCGDSDNGFGLLVNMANLAPGAHEAVLYADGQIIAQHAFNTAARSSGEFAENLEGCAITEGFPADDKETILRWTTSQQGFQITEERARMITENINGFWLGGYYWETSIWTYRNDCGALAIYLYANLEDEFGGKDILRMAGEVGEEKTLLKSTADDWATREASLLINSNSEIQIDITMCQSNSSLACDYTPVGARVTLTKVPNLMDMAINPEDP